MSLGDNIKKIRERKELLQKKQLVAELTIPYTSYNKGGEQYIGYCY